MSGVSASAGAAVAQQAPNPKAYIESGVVKPHDLVDVKKVLVIGSGGLAIGQAGEFDYSGSSPKYLSRACDESHGNAKNYMLYRIAGIKGP